MDMTGTYTIPASREVVWAALNDPDVLKVCIPGCEQLQKRSDTEFEAAVVAKIGPVKARFTGNVNLSDLAPPTGYRITGQGSGGVAGFAKGGATVRLVEDGPNTVMTYEAQAQVGGKLAQLGSRLIDSVARKMADEFFSAFAEQLSGSRPQPAEAPAGVAGASAAASAAAASKAAPAAARSKPLGERIRGWWKRVRSWFGAGGSTVK
jgi:uncharacterized protein